jgi:hypothetical protein
MFENINQVTLVLELSVTFFGVFLAFMLGRLIDWKKEQQAKKELLKNLSCELNEIKKGLTGDAYRLYPDVWDSAVSSGQLDLLDSEQLSKLTKVYRIIKGTDYEAIRVRDAKAALMQANPNPYNNLENNWINLSNSHRIRMEKTRAEIDAVLKEPWLKQYTEGFEMKHNRAKGAVTLAVD